MRTLWEFGFMTKALAGRRLVFVAGLGLACLLFVGLLTPRLCRADAVYNVSGTFGTADYTGPLNGGTFTGTFDATLPFGGSQENITTFNIDLISASGVILADLTNTTPGFFGYFQPQGTQCSGGVACGVFLFGHGSTFLQLTTPTGFTGGPVDAFNVVHGAFAGIGGNTAADDSIVTSGSITPTPEPSTLALMGIALLLCGLLFRRRISSGNPLAAARLHGWIFGGGE